MNPLEEIKGIAILVILILGGLFYWHVESRLATADRLETENSALTERVSHLEGQAQAYDAALLDRAQREQAGRADLRNIDRNVQQVKHDDPNAAAHLGAVIPDSVRHAYIGAGRQPGAANAGAAGPDRR